MWGLYLIGLVAYIPATPVQNYLSLTLRRIGYSTFDSNMLSIPSAVLQIILMLLLAYSSDFFNERTLHCMVGEFWILPLLAALLALPSGGVEWGRFALTTMISGCKFTYFSDFFIDIVWLTKSIQDPYFHPIVAAWISENSFDVKKRAITAATYNVIVQMGAVIGSRKFFISFLISSTLAPVLSKIYLHIQALTCAALEIYRADDSPYYYRGNKVLISICVLALATFMVQREYLRYLNRRKNFVWESMTVEERLSYQDDRKERERDGNKRLDFRFKY